MTSAARAIVVMIVVLPIAVFGAGPTPMEALAQQDGWGTIKGRIVWGPKEIPQPKPVPGGAQAGPAMDQTAPVVNDKNRGLRWTIIWLANDDPKDSTPLPIHPNLHKTQQRLVKTDIVGREFHPRVVALRQGQELLVTNTSPLAQGISWVGVKNIGARSLPPGGQFRIDDLVSERLPISIRSLIVPSMIGRIAVFAHPYFAVTDADGAFEIKDAPAGKYRLVIWNNAYNDGVKGRYGQPITIPARDTLDLGDIAFTPPKD
jgi:hypothetical protein